VVKACVRFLVRPDTVSLLLAAAVLGLLRRDEQKNDDGVFAVAPIQLRWANIHGFQAIGVTLVGMALFGELTSSWLSGSGGSGMRRDRVLRLCAVLALSVGGNSRGAKGMYQPAQKTWPTRDGRSRECEHIPGLESGLEDGWYEPYESRGSRTDSVRGWG